MSVTRKRFAAPASPDAAWDDDGDAIAPGEEVEALFKAIIQRAGPKDLLILPEGERTRDAFWLDIEEPDPNGGRVAQTAEENTGRAADQFKATPGDATAERLLGVDKWYEVLQDFDEGHSHLAHTEALIVRVDAAGTNP